MSIDLSTEVTELALYNYENYSPKEMELMLAESLWKLGEKSGGTPRGSDFWKKLREGLLKETVQNRGTIPATIEFTASRTVDQLQSAGIDLGAYKTVTALIVALIVRAAFHGVDTTK